VLVQIEQRMDPKALKPGDENHSPEQRQAEWEKDMANDLHHDNVLWLWAAKAGHQFMEWRTTGIMDTGDKGQNTQWVHAEHIENTDNMCLQYAQ